MEPVYCILDYETRSEVDLKKCGAWEYSVHPSTQILCVAWRIGTKAELPAAKTQIWSPAIPSGYGSLKRALIDPAVKLVAHNALFEQVITRNVLSKIIHEPDLKKIPVNRWTCTASLAAALALPRKLEHVCGVLKLSDQKDKDGHRLMLKMSKPRKATLNDPSKWHNKKSDLLRLMAYCEADIAAETALFLALPPLTPFERKVWELDQRINMRGFRVDRPLVTTTLRMIEEETKRLNDETLDMTGLLSTNQRNEVLKWLEKEGVYLPDLQAKTIADALQAGMADGAPKRLLEIRQAVSKTSTAKYVAFDQRSRSDGRCRDILVYHAASTGRWGGAGVQPQNFPRGVIKDTAEAARVLAEGDLDWVRMVYGDPMTVFSSCLRAMIIPSDGCEFVSADYATIEVRVLFWLAEHEDGLRMFHNKEDIYRDMAAAIYHRKVEAILNPSTERDLGKSAVLGCGFGMGKKKFFVTCKQKGQEVTEALAETAVASYREKHHPVVTLWGNLERAAIRAVHSAKAGKPRAFAVNKTKWWVEGDFLFCELPSGRRLAYFGPELRYEETPWGEPRAVLYHWGIDSLTKQWVCTGTYGGKLTENVVQATARDFMADAMVRVAGAGYDVVLSVHDELLCEQPKGSNPASRFEELMAEIPPWGVGCPVEAKGWVGERYKK